MGLTLQKAGVFFFSLSASYPPAQSCLHRLWDEGLRAAHQHHGPSPILGDSHQPSPLSSSAYLSTQMES